MGAPRSLWTDDMRDTLRKVWFDPALTMEEIGHAIGRSAQVARNEAQRLGLPSRIAILGRPNSRERLGDRAKPPPVRPLPPGARTLPLLPSEETVVTESLAWTCRCGAWCWNHYLHCAACGTEKPPPPPEEPPSDVARAEPPWR